MALAPDRTAEKSLQQEIASAKKLLESDHKAKLVFSRLPEKPLGINGSNKVFEFRTGQFLRMCAEYRGTWFEAMPTRVTDQQRISTAEALGFDPQKYRQLIVHPQVAYLGNKEYFVPNQKKGGE
jgi:hypothetical protein